MKLDSFGCRTLSKAIIDFLYFVFTSNFKGNSYLDEKESIIGAIEIKKVNEFKLQENLLSELIRYLNKIYEKKIEGDGYAHPLLEFYPYELSDTIAADETYIKILGKTNYIFLLLFNTLLIRL